MYVNRNRNKKQTVSFFRSVYSTLYSTAPKKAFLLAVEKFEVNNV
jgi:hypothetical protein